MLWAKTVFFLFTVSVLQKSFGHATEHCNNANVGIVGGYTILIEEAPFMAALKFKVDDSLYCAAAIIHDRFLLTAASCHDSIPDGQNLTLVASMGSEKYQNTSNNIIMEIDKFLCHEAFDKLTGKNDICVLKLEKPVPLGNNIAKINLPGKNFEVKTGTMLNVTGWGYTKNDTISRDPDPVDLHQTTIPVVSHRCCHEADKTVDNTMLCAGAPGRGPCYVLFTPNPKKYRYEFMQNPLQTTYNKEETTWLCQGDAGDPLTNNGTLVGIASHLVLDHPGPLCGSGMDVYTKVASFVDWINDTITNNL